jgi:NADPH:quinone reductase-like Zn-dependent oxidoreductase
LLPVLPDSCFAMQATIVPQGLCEYALRMKGIVVHEFGSPDVFKYEDLPMPSAGPGQSIVRVCAAGVGNWDALVVAGESGLGQTLPLIPGSDLAGTLDSGDTVYGAVNPQFTGAFVEAASVPVVGVTAWQMVHEHAKIAANQSVLVHGGGGNVGWYAVQLAKLAGARVVTTASAADRAELEAFGAEVIDFRTQRFEDEVHDVDVAIDTVGGETLSRSFRVVRPGGIVVSSVEEPPANDPVRARVRSAYFIVAVTTQRLDALTELFERGQLKPRVGETLPLECAKEALEMVAGAPHRPGRIVLRVAS